MNNAPLQLRPDEMVNLLQDQPIGQTPHITLHTFCETPAVAASIRRAASDRRLARAATDVSPGGIRAATAYCHGNAAPDVLILESRAARAELLAELTDLAQVCDTNTRVIVIGGSNDIALYRELVSSGISEYLLAPVDALTIIGAVLRLFPEQNARPIGKVCAVIGTKGGVGSSVLAQNLAWAVSQSGAATMLADLDLQFGTAALNYNIDCRTGFADLLPEDNRLDGALLERLLYKHGPHLSVLPCATAAQITSDPDQNVIEKMVDLARATFPHVLLDLPNAWTPLVRSALRGADEIILVAEPDLGNLRNARCMLDYLKQVRPNDSPVRLLLNRVGMSKRNEIKPEKFAHALETDLWAQIEFDPALFSKAAANGQMIAEVSGKAAVASLLKCLAAQLTGKPLSPNRRALSRFWNR